MTLVLSLCMLEDSITNEQFFFLPGDAGDWCQQRFCECDQAAIDCMSQSSYNSTLRGLAESSCSATNQTGNYVTAAG